MTIICCICPGGCGQPASQAVNQPVSRCDRPTNCLGRQLALSCPCQRWRCSIWFNLDAPLDAQRSTPDAIGRCRFRHNLYKVSQFLALCICCWQHRAPWPVARSPLPLCPWPRTASHCGTPLLLPQDNNKRLHFAATKLRHKFRHFVASLCSL